MSANRSSNFTPFLEMLWNSPNTFSAISRVLKLLKHCQIVSQAGDNLASEHLPSETDLLADASFLVTADLFRDNMVRLEMMSKVLNIY